MQKEKITEEYKLEVVERLRTLGFSIKADVRYRGQSFALVAKRTTFEIERFGFVETFFVLAGINIRDATTLKEYSKKCFAYASRSSRMPLPRGLFRSTVCYSVAICYGADAAVANAVKNTEPPRHYSATEIPVICDLEAGQLYYLERTPDWGSVYWDGIRDNIVKVLSPKEAERASGGMTEEEAGLSKKSAGTEHGEVLDEFEISQVELRWTRVRIAWFLYLLAPVAFVIICNVAGPEANGASHSDGATYGVKSLFCVLSAIALCLSYLARRASAKPESRINRFMGQYSYISGPVAAAIACVSISFFGLVLFYVKREFFWLYLLVGIAVVAHIFLRPRKQELIKQAIYSKRDL